MLAEMAAPEMVGNAGWAAAAEESSKGWVFLIESGRM